MEKEVVNNKGDKRKLIIIISAIILLILISIIICLVIIKKDKDNEVTENTYENKTYYMYVDIKPALKIEIEERYSECSTGLCLVEIMAKDYEVIEEDINGVFNDYKILKEEELNNVLQEILDLAKDADVDVMDVDFYSESEEVGGYLNLLNYTYGFYKSDVDSVDEFYGRIMNDDNEEENVEEIITKEYKIKNPEIIIKHKNKKWKYDVEKIDSIVISIKGTYSDLDLLNTNFEFYIDVEDEKVGENSLKIKVYDLELDYEINPKKVNVVINDGSTTTKEVGNEDTTKGTTTTKTTTTSTTTTK